MTVLSPEGEHQLRITTQPGEAADDQHLWLGGGRLVVDPSDGQPRSGSLFRVLAWAKE